MKMARLAPVALGVMIIGGLSVGAAFRASQGPEGELDFAMEPGLQQDADRFVTDVLDQPSGHLVAVPSEAPSGLTALLLATDDVVAYTQGRYQVMTVFAPSLEALPQPCDPEDGRRLCFRREQLSAGLAVQIYASRREAFSVEASDVPGGDTTPAALKSFWTRASFVPPDEAAWLVALAASPVGPEPGSTE